MSSSPSARRALLQVPVFGSAEMPVTISLVGSVSVFEGCQGSNPVFGFSRLWWLGHLTTAIRSGFIIGAAQ